MNPTDDFGTLYRQMTEEELLELAGQSATLTEPARWALRAELSSRGIGEDAIRTAGENAVQESSSRNDRSHLKDSKLICIFSSNNEMEARLIQGLIQAAGIESVIGGQAMGGILRGVDKIDVLVLESDAKEARRIIAEQQQIPPQEED